MPNETTTTQETTTTTADAPTFESMVPSEYHTADWFVGIRDKESPIAELAKMYEGAQKVIGSRPQFLTPGEDATPEQIAAYHKHIGVPEKADDYSLPEIEWADEHKDMAERMSKERNQDVLNRMRKAAHEIGVTPKQFAKLFEEQERATVEQLIAEEAELKKAEETLHSDFQVQAQRLFGTQKDAILQTGKKLIEENVPDNLKPYVNELDNKSLLVLASVLHGINNKYVKEDKTVTAGATGRSYPLTEDGISQEANDYIQANKEAFYDTRNPNHQNVVDTWRAIYRKINDLPQHKK